MQYELHATALVEEALRDDCRYRRDGAEDGAAGDDIADELLSTGIIDAAFLFKPGNRGSDRCVGLADVAGEEIRHADGDVFAQRADPARELHGALRGFAPPEGNGGRLAVRVFDIHAASSFDGGDAPGSVAELDDVADRRVDGEVL